MSKPSPENETPQKTAVESAKPANAFSFKRALEAGISAAKKNAMPGLFLWFIASAIALGYFFLPPVTNVFKSLGELKSRGGYLYSAISTAIFGGVLPFLYSSIRARLKKESAWNVKTWQAALFLLAFWAWKGVEVDALYRLQSYIFGEGATFSVLAPKVLSDQFIYNPLWAGWTQVLVYWFLDMGFKPSRKERQEFRQTFGQRLITILFSTWGVWLPMVTIIYSMPADLQIPLFNIVLCFWGLILVAL